MLRPTASVLSCVLVLGACGGGDDDDAAADPVEEPAPTTVSESIAGTTTVALPTRTAIETHEETYVDASRATDANREYPGAPDRTIRVVFRVPAGTGPYPVVLFSHGWIATPEVYNSLLDELANNGYLVVAPAYPLSNGAAPGGPIPSDVVNQPADASFVLDQVIAASADESSWLYGLVDEEHIAAGGHSLGGFTTMGFFNSCCLDERVDAAFPVAARMPQYEGTPYEGVDTPILIIHGDDDELVGYSSSEDIYAQANAPKYFLTLIGGKHADFALGAGQQQWEISIDAILAFLGGYLTGDDDALAELPEIGNVEGVSTLVTS